MADSRHLVGEEAARGELLIRLRALNADLVVFGIARHPKPASHSLRSLRAEQPNRESSSPARPYHSSPSTGLRDATNSGDVIALDLGDGDVARLAKTISARLANRARWQSVRERFDALHPRVLAGDVAARAKVAELAVLEVNRALRLWPDAAREPDEVLYDVAVDTVVGKYLWRPEIYDPDKGHPLWWLVKVAKNALRDQWNARACRISLDRALQLEHLPPEWQLDDPIAQAEQRAERDAKFASVARSSVEAQVIHLRRDGCTILEVADALELGGLPVDEQRKHVNRIVNTLGKRGRRHSGS